MSTAKLGSQLKCFISGLLLENLDVKVLDYFFHKFIFENGPFPASFSFIFGLLKANNAI